MYIRESVAKPAKATTTRETESQSFEKRARMDLHPFAPQGCIVTDAWSWRRVLSSATSCRTSGTPKASGCLMGEATARDGLPRTKARQRRHTRRPKSRVLHCGQPNLAPRRTFRSLSTAARLAMRECRRDPVL